MNDPARDIMELAHAKHLPLHRQGYVERDPDRGWSRAALSGRLVEISSGQAPARLTVALELVLDSQRQGETAAWITDTSSSFFPPDAAEGGIDIEALVIIRIPDLVSAPRAADKLIRSGAFGLVVMDMTSAMGSGNTWEAGEAWLSRLLGLARMHDTAVALLTEKRRDAPSLGSLVSLRGEARRRSFSGPSSSSDDGEAAALKLVEVHILKDKRQAPDWIRAELCRGPAGLR